MVHASSFDPCLANHMRQGTQHLWHPNVSCARTLPNCSQLFIHSDLQGFTENCSCFMIPTHTIHVSHMTFKPCVANHITKKSNLINRFFIRIQFFTIAYHALISRGSMKTALASWPPPIPLYSLICQKTNHATSLTARNYANYVAADATGGWKAFETTMTGLIYFGHEWKSMVLCFKAGTSSTNWVGVLLQS